MNRVGDRVEVASLEEFLVECAERHIGGAAMRVVDEPRLRVRDDGMSEVAMVSFVELFAYHDGVVLAALLRDVDAEAIEAALVAARLTVRRRSANLG